MERDLDALRAGYSANSYIDTLEEGLLRNYHAGERFMHDNARIHTANKTVEFLETYSI